jgi:hypothetical protein
MSHAAESTTVTTATAAIEPLLRMLADVRRRARTWIWVESLAWVTLAAAAAFWASLAFDWSVEPPPAVRGVVLAAAVGLLLWLIVRLLVARLAVPLGDEALAVIVERGHPQFRDGLSTAVGLARQQRADFDLALVARTVADAGALVGGVDPGRLFRQTRLRQLASLALVAAATVGLLATARPDIARVWVRRSVLLANEPWPRRTQLDAEGFHDGVRKVARGGDVDVIVHARTADGPPRAVDLRMRGSAGWKTVRMGTRGGATATEQTFGHVIEGVTDDMRLEVRGGDARLRNLRLAVVEPPAVESVAILATPPAYLGGPARRPPVARRVALPRGSRVEIGCAATKPLARATLRAQAVGPPAAEDAVVIGDLAAGGPAATAVDGVVENLDGDLVVTLELLDADGLANREPITFMLAAVPDEIPRVAVRLRGISTAVTARGRLPIEGTITDDHAVAAGAVRLVWQPPAGRKAGTDKAGASVERVVPLAAVRGGAPLVELLAERIETVPLESLGLVPGGRLEVTVTATDACTLDGKPQTGASDTWALDVISPESLQAMLEAREIVLRRRFEAAIADLGQARDRLGRDQEAGAVARFAEAVARATGETREIAAAFRDIRLEFDNNGLLSPELESRLIAQIAVPLEAVAEGDLPGLAAACRAAAADAAAVGRQADDVLARMRAVLARMMELESFNEVIERLRSVIRTQEEIRAETLRRQKERAREALE